MPAVTNRVTGKSVVQHGDQTAYLTPKGVIAVYAADKGDGELYIYPNYERFAADQRPRV